MSIIVRSEISARLSKMIYLSSVQSFLFLGMICVAHPLQLLPSRLPRTDRPQSHCCRYYNHLDGRTILSATIGKTLLPNNGDETDDETKEGKESQDNNNRPAYVVIEAKITDLKGFSSYAQKVPSIVAKYGGEYLVLGGEHTPLEGDWEETRIVLHQWPNATMAKAFWESKEYQQIKKLRDGTGIFRIMLLEGIEKEYLS